MKSIAAALTLFTRIPVWRVIDIPASAYSSTVVYWPLIGWVTGCLSALILYALSLVMPMFPAVASAIICKLGLTGALHEDGLADFCDGFGGGRDKDKILRIMKDSHIGTYGVIGLICYYILIISLLTSLPNCFASILIFSADPFSKFCASQITNCLPYARPEGAKNKISYSKMTIKQISLNTSFGILPLIPLGVFNTYSLISIAFPIAALFFMIGIMKHRIAGYTGDCCGATYLVCEISMIFAVVLIFGICTLF